MYMNDMIYVCVHSKPIVSHAMFAGQAAESEAFAATTLWRWHGSSVTDGREGSSAAGGHLDWEGELTVTFYDYLYVGIQLPSEKVFNL